MSSRQWAIRIATTIFCVAPLIDRPARAQYGTLANAGYPTIDLYGHGYGSTPTGGYGAFPYGYAPLTGNVGSGYQAAGPLINPAAPPTAAAGNAAPRQVFDIRTAAPGWYTPARRARRRLRAQPDVPTAPPFDDSGKIDWPKTIPDDPSLAALRRPADQAVRAVVLEAKTSGHASVRPVIEAKNKLTAFEHKVLPEVNKKSATEGTALETFFLHLDKALDVLTFRK